MNNKTINPRLQEKARLNTLINRLEHIRTRQDVLLTRDILDKAEAAEN